MRRPSVPQVRARLRHESRRLARRALEILGQGERLDVFLARRRALRALTPGGWHQQLLTLLESGVALSTTGRWASASRDSVPLVVCLWNRPERIDDIIAMLESLDPTRPVRLLLWNNAVDERDSYAWLQDHEPRGALASIDLVHSAANIGGLARFVAVRLLRNAGYEGPVLMLDDDQDVTPSFVGDLLANYQPRSIVAWWAFDFGPSYWDRVQIEPGDRADHGGTGGTVLDSSLVDDDRFFLSLPERYAFLEDQWMSHYARSLGWTIVKADTEIGFVLEHKNQYHGLHERKDEFHRHLKDGTVTTGRPLRSSSRGRRRGRFHQAGS